MSDEPSFEDPADAAEFETYYVLMAAGWRTLGRGELPRSWARQWYEFEKAGGEQ